MLKGEVWSLRQQVLGCKYVVPLWTFPWVFRALVTHSLTASLTMMLCWIGGREMSSCFLVKFRCAFPRPFFFWELNFLVLSATYWYLTLLFISFTKSPAVFFSSGFHMRIFGLLSSWIFSHHRQCSLGPSCFYNSLFTPPGYPSRNRNRNVFIAEYRRSS